LKAQLQEKNWAVSPHVIQEEILDKLAYFAVFNHPLRASEIQNLLHNYYDYQLVADMLSACVEKNLCVAYDGFFAVKIDIKEAIKSRTAHEQNATQYFTKLPFYALIISNFPFVRAVAVSGSLSKGVMHADGDIDYFIITAHNRLWLARVLLVLFKKLFLFNQRKYFCVNYFVSENHLQIPDENIFTATEIATLIPVYGFDAIQTFKSKNSWTRNFYGHYENPYQPKEVAPNIEWVKNLIEFLLNNFVGHALDIFCMKITIWRWRVKFKHVSSSTFNLTMRSTRHVSKHHPRDFQTYVLKKMKDLRPTTMHVSR
jgi:hypothetical protein